MTVAATITFPEAARTWDAVVVGAGIAGAVAARTLAKQGLEVLLVDRATFPRYKVCGCCLSERGLSTLAMLGLGLLVENAGGVHLHQFKLAAWGRRADVSLPGGRAISRQAFDTALVEAAIAAGASFLPQTLALPGQQMEKTRGVRLKQGADQQSVLARLVIAADGLGGHFLANDDGSEVRIDPTSRIGAGVIADTNVAFYGPGVIYMACSQAGYVGLVRLEDGRLDVATALDPSRVKELGLGQTVVGILHEAGFPEVPQLAELPWRGTPLLTRKASRPAGYRTFALGDAAGYVEPFTGEGMTWALAAGAAIGPLAVKACRQWHPDLAMQWSVRYRQTVARRQRACRIVAGALRRPRMVRGVVAALAWAPALARPFVRYLNVSSARSIHT